MHLYAKHVSELVDPRCPKCGAVALLGLAMHGPYSGYGYGCGSRFVGGVLVEDKFCVGRQRDQWEMAAFCERERTWDFCNVVNCPPT